MQSLYALRNSAVTTLKPGEASKILNRHFDNTIALFAWQIWFLTEVARYAEVDAKNRSAKHLPNESDLNVDVKIAGNELLWRILESDFFVAAKAKVLMSESASVEWIRKVYGLLRESNEYGLYNNTPGRERKSEREILEYIYTDLMLANDDFTDFAEDLYNNWDDDAEMLRMMIMQFLQKPGVFKITEMVGKDKMGFAINLLDTTVNRHDQLREIITPKLRNWDAERLAQLDLILIEMGVCEFLYFETIPPKVTINEYIDLAKAYSTPQSGQFVNGILDSVKIELEAADLLHKVVFKKGIN